MNPHRLRGIAFAVSIPLLMFACAFLLVSGVQLYAFRQAMSVVDGTVETQLPALNLTATLVRECEWIRGMSFRLAQSENDLVLRRGLEELLWRIRELEGTIGRMESVGFYPGRLHALKAQIASFEDIAETLEQRVARMLEIRNQRTRLVKSLRVLSRELENLSSDAPGYTQIEHWNHHLHMSISLLLALCTDIDAPYGLRVRNDLYAQLGEARKELDPASSMRLDPDVAETGDRLYEQIVICALDENGVLSLFRRLHAASREVGAQGLRINALADAILLNAERLSEQARDDTARSRDTLRTWMSSFFFSLMGIMLFSLSLIACVYVYLAKCVVSPVIRLNECMRLRTRNVKTPLPRDGAGEVREMARSVAFFINRLEEREEELQRSHDHLEEQVRDRTAELDRLSRRLILAQEEERFRLAAELHDDVGATISVVKFGIERALLMLRERDVVQAHVPLAEAVELVKGLARQLRRIQNELRPAYIDLGLLNSIRIFCRDYQAAHPELRLEVEAETDETLPPSLRVVIFRLVQESLNNIAKHAGATRASLSIITTGEEVVVSIRDDGRGFDPTAAAGAGRGLGLKTMRERVELSGGAFTLETAPGKGTLITADWSRNAAVWTREDEPTRDSPHAPGRSDAAT